MRLVGRFKQFSEITILMVAVIYGTNAVAQAKASVVYTIVIENLKFSPGMIVTRPGDTILFRNEDKVPHSVTEKSSKLFDSGLLNSGTEWNLVAPSGGTVVYHCTVHPGMEGEIKISR